MEAIGPQRGHRHLAREEPHLRDDPVGIFSIHKIIVDSVAHLAFQLERGVVVDLCRRIVVPVDAVTLDALEEMSKILEVGLHHPSVFASLRHLPVLEQSQSVDRLILVDGETLLHLERPLVDAFVDGRELIAALLQEHVALAVGKGHFPVGHGDSELSRLISCDTCGSLLRHLHLLRLGDDHFRLELRGTPLLLHDMHDRWGEELDFLRGGSCGT